MRSGPVLGPGIQGTGQRRPSQPFPVKAEGCSLPVMGKRLASGTGHLRWLVTPITASQQFQMHSGERQANPTEEV